MTTIENMSPAEQEVAAKAQEVPAAALECATCGRDCKHVAHQNGGGTAGGDKGSRWAETARSSARCPSCMQKPHRKEGRPHQINNCYIAQAGLKMGLTTYPTATAEVYRVAADMIDAGIMKLPPTEKQMTQIIAGVPIEDAMAPTVKAAPKVSKDVKVAPGEELENVQIIAGAPMPDMPELAPGTAIKTAAEREAERNAKKAEKEREKADAKAAREKEREEAKAAKEAAKADAKKTAGQKAADLKNGQKPVKSEEVTPETEPDGYDPKAGVGEPWVEDEEEVLTEEQIALLARK